ncbi:MULTISPECIES: YqgE/AlgH family protein [Elizabethkingia]|uniref:YqgE/AlgH family protein n=1 Tax=Elizabethkingia TaxID=308865 RepID=UPI0021A63D4D|nr:MULTISPECIES: YqgE/AlgH family protein [Elizabethkingia]MCT3687871.1 YqgE/AlgH family protein [Elizabethkingia anophelis]MCT3706800.1 YqgE/AlgH family protein [Elizabethkingia anophelis]MCT3714001.1 YqgE/AlgH family protein [Elizabethkingia anophelis]MCT3717420.1 YqgE/AlgH family protein [Elizabethkingia anophelis]MCT3731907.1 YqgE/AlgH family protein [Elizabethkingia anophelis]
MNNSYKGKILISTPDISGDIFSRSVVLIIEHNESGAFGLILNKKNKFLSKRFNKIMQNDIEVYEGGPISQDKIFFIIRGERATSVNSEINDDYYLTDNVEEVIELIVKQELETKNIKIFSGYSGWSPQQLEGEIKNKMWTVIEVINLDYTESNDQNLWKKIMQGLAGEFLLWANAPEDISQN